MVSENVRVCKEWFPKTNGFIMNEQLKTQLDLLIKNVVKDWDFTIIISGGGEVRVGKSVLAMQIATYWTYKIEKIHGIKVPLDIKTNIIFEWKKLIETGNALGQKSKYCALIYDEAGETMEGTKTMRSELRSVRDYLRECGQYNFLNILVLPEYFDLPKGIALTRSTFLLDVYYSATAEGLFNRGYFKFYSRKQKKKLYLKGKKELNYHAAPWNFDGRFPNFYPIDEGEYRESKREALKTREHGKKDVLLEVRNVLFWLLCGRFKMKQNEIIKIIKEETGLEFTRQMISKAIAPRTSK